MCKYAARTECSEPRSQIRTSLGNIGDIGKETKMKKPLSGANAASEAMRQINPDVCAAYPITPQTQIMEKFSEFVADGLVKTELIRVESEHSAMSCCVGSSAAGARTMTATSSQGLALMWEIVYIAPALRLPIVMNVVNRALSSPINIHCDHSDMMGCRDSGWIQIYSENNQEVYEHTLIAQRIAEHKEVLLPVMVGQDGFITSHAVEGVDILDDNAVKAFIGEYTPKNPLLDIDNPVTVGALDFFDYYFEHKMQQIDAMEKSKKAITEVFAEFGKTFGKTFDFFEKYMMDDADLVIVAIGSTCGTAKDVVDQLRNEGKKVGLVKVRVFRPFMNEVIVDVLKNAKAVAVLDRAVSFGAFGGPLFMEVRNAFYNHPSAPHITNYIYGLGGREINFELLRKVYSDIEQIKNTGKIQSIVNYLGVRE